MEAIIHMDKGKTSPKHSFKIGDVVIDKSNLTWVVSGFLPNPNFVLVWNSSKDAHIVIYYADLFLWKDTTALENWIKEKQKPSK